MSRDLESVLLGGVLDAESPAMRSNAGTLLDMAGMAPEDFNDPRVRVAWSVALRLSARRRPVDAVAVYAAGRTTKAFNESDLEWLTALQAGNALDRERFADLVEQLRTASRAAALAKALTRGVEALRANAGDLTRIVGEVESALAATQRLASDDGTGSDDVLDLAAEWEKQEAGGTAPALLPTGIAALDEVIGGLPNNLTVICGLPSVGKSALLGAIIDAQLAAGLRVGLFGLEDGTRWLAKRILAREMAMPVRAVGYVTRNQEQQERFPDVGSEVSKRLSRLVCYRHDSVTIDELCRRAASWRTTKGIDVLYVDHGGEIDHHSERIDEHRLRVAESYRRLRNLALRFGMPVVVLAHTARPGDDIEERPPRLTEIAESAYIERRARLVLGLWRRQQEPDTMRVTVLKQTEGEANVTVRLDRLTQAALISRDGGERVNLHEERQQEAKAAKERREAEKAAARAAADAEKRKRAPPQRSFVDEPEEAA